MPDNLRYLTEEIAVGLEIYALGRLGAHTLKSAYVLCDDYTELCSKLYLKVTNPTWSDQASPGRFKNYHRVMQDVEDSMTGASAFTPVLRQIQDRMKERRVRRNDFFHSTSLLDLSVSQTNVAQGFVDLLDYGSLLFGQDWDDSIESGPRGMKTLELLVRLDLRAVTDPRIPPQVNEVLREQPRNKSRVSARGAHVADHPADLHTVLAVVWGGADLRNALEALLT